MANLQINFSQLKVTLDEALDKKTEEIFGEFQKTLDSPVFAWGGITYRKNGEIVSDPRNAIDTGNLRDSMFIEKSQDLKRSIVFGADYSEDVFVHSTVDLVEFTIERMN